jgi:uncharacterized protein
VAGVRAADSAGWLPYVATDDADATVASALAGGGTVLAGPYELRDAARVATVADPTGAALGLWQRRRFAGAQAVNEFGTVGWAELATREPDTARTFYGTVFGWEEQAAETATGVPYTEWYAGGRYVAGMFDMRPRVPASVPPHWTVSLLVGECAATAERAEELGGTVLLPPTELGAGTYAQLADPLGAGFRIVELAPQLLATI